MNNFFNLTGTLSRAITRYFIHPEIGSDGTVLEEVVETSRNEDRVYETETRRGLSVLNCGHVLHQPSQIGCLCDCGNVVCLACTRPCSRCGQVKCSACSVEFDGYIVCRHCRGILLAKYGALLTGRVTGKALWAAGKVLMIPFK